MNKLEKSAPVIFTLLWSTGFVGAKYILPYAEPFVFLTIRYASAAFILLLIAKAINEPLRISSKQVTQSIRVGLFLQVIYIGGVFYAISLGVPAGVTAVIVSLQPILVSVIAFRILGEGLGVKKIFGLILGLVGVLFLLLPKIFQGEWRLEFSQVGLLAGALALLGTTTGYLLQKKGGGEIPFLPGTAIQFLTATFIFAVAGLLFEDWNIELNIKFWLALAWIVLALSIGSIFLLFYLLKNDSASSVSSLYYLVPPLTAIQAFLLFGERITQLGILGMVLAGIGTYLVTRNSANAGH
ncbi:MAG: DMT family transporter [Candidatus Nanopelagicaceae bacterium]